MILKSPKIFKIFILLFIISLSTVNVYATGGENGDKKENKSQVDNNTLGYYSQIFGFDIKKIFNLELYDLIDKWLGTPYRYAGNSIKGIDCSGFAKVLYKSAYDILLEGSSADIFKSIVPVAKDELSEGDLVFFKVRKGRISHVGVYLGQNKFAHASSSSGVMISDLDEPYWKQRYFKGGRMPEIDNRFQSSR